MDALIELVKGGYEVRVTQARDMDEDGVYVYYEASAWRDDCQMATSIGICVDVAEALTSLYTEITTTETSA